MITLLSVIAVGFMLGVAHATDPDHVIAVTTIVNREGNLRRAALIGLAWGVGHTLTVFLVGSAVILLGVVIPGQVEVSMELLVSLMLIVLGVAGMRGFFHSLPQGAVAAPEGSGYVHSHHHRHGDYVHNHPHGHDPEDHGHRESQTPLARLDRRLGRTGVYRHLRPFIVGVVHGLAGSAAVALLILTTIPNSHWGVLYLLIFGLGTCTGMTLFTLSITSASILMRRRYRGFSTWIGLSSGVLSVAFGVFMAYRLLR